MFDAEVNVGPFCYVHRVLVAVASSSLAKISGKCSTVHPPPALFFLKWRLARVHWFHSLGQDQSTVAQRVETTVAECALTSYV